MMLTDNMPWMMLSDKGKAKAAEKFLEERDFVCKRDFLTHFAEAKVGYLSNVTGDVLGPAWDAARALWDQLAASPIEDHPRILCAYYDTPILWDPDGGFLITCNTRVECAEEYLAGGGGSMWHCPEDWPAERHVTQQEEILKTLREEGR